MGLTLGACNSNESAQSNPTSSTDADAAKVAGNATVFAAASMNKVGEELAQAFKTENPDAEISFNFAGSSALVRQISEGANADMFISADEANMDKAKQLPAFAGAEPKVIALNKLVLVTADGNPGQISSIKDTSDHLVASCAPEVPCGTLTQEALDHAGVTLNKNSQEANVTDVATKVSTGSVDAGFIYSTDAQQMKKFQDNTVIDLDGIEANDYPMALTTTGSNNEVAKHFAEFMSTQKAKDILNSYGFGTN